MSSKTWWGREDGNVLISSIIVGVLVSASVLTYCSMTLSKTTETVQTVAREKALNYAESGMEGALMILRSPGVLAALPVNGSTTTVLSFPGGRAEVTSRRQNTDISLVDIYSTGYFYLRKGSFVDPLTNRPAQRAVVRAKMRMNNVSEFLAATATRLPISYGTNATGGKVYSPELSFDPRYTNPYNPTRVTTALWYTSCVNDVSADVIFTQAPYNAQRLSYPLNLPHLDTTLRAYYLLKASGLGQVVAANVAFAGLRSAPASTYPAVYYSTASLRLGAPGNPLVVNGVYVIYAVGDVYIDNNIVLNNGSSWLGILAERNIRISVSAPDNLALNGTFMTNGNFFAEIPGTARPLSAVITINGGIIAHAGMGISAVWPYNRVYTYATTNSTAFLMPNVTDQLEYKILGGRF